MNGSRRIMARSTVRISGSGRLKAWTWVVAIPGPETISSAIRSRPIPVSLNRPSAPVVVAIVTSHWLPGTGRDLGADALERQGMQALPEVAGGAVLGLGDPAGDVPLFVVPDPSGLDAGADDGPALEVDDPPFDRRPFRDERHHLLGGPVGRQGPLAPAHPIPGGGRDEPGVEDQVTFDRGGRFRVWASGSRTGRPDRWSPWARDWCPCRGKPP